MVGTKFYTKRARVYTFLALYGLLALMGVGLSARAVSQDQKPSTAEGFTLIFGAGMAVMTWIRGRKPRVVIGSDRLEIYQQHKPQFIAYKSISTVTRMKDHRLVIAQRVGHDLKQATVWLKELEQADADRLAEFCLKKRWKASQVQG